jgi:hypothetical protein
VPVGFYSLTWDESQKDGSGNLLNPVIAVVATFRCRVGSCGDRVADEEHVALHRNAV